LLSSDAARDILDRLAKANDPTALEAELAAAAVPDIYVPRDNSG